MNRFLDRLARFYAPLGRRGLLMDGQFRFAPDAQRPQGGRKARARIAAMNFQRPSTRTLA